MMDHNHTMDMMGGMGAMMLVGAVLLLILVGVAVYLGVRAAQSGGSRELSPREMLQHRFARGELTADEYRERQGVLREDEESRGGRLMRRR